VIGVTRLAGTANATTTTMTYDSIFNQITSATDPLNHAVLFRYDARGNLTSMTDARGKDALLSYGPNGEPASITDATGKTTHLSYLLGDLVGVTDPLGRSTTIFVDAAGRVASTVNPLGERTRMEFDSLNRPVSSFDALGNLTTFGYDATGNEVSVTDPRGGVTTSTYDVMGRLATRQDPLLHTETFAYDSRGNLTSHVDRNGLVTKGTFDALGRQTFAGFNAVTNGGVTTYESSITGVYDAGNRLTQLVDSLAGTVTRTYDGLDRLTSEVTPQGSLTYTYDLGSRPATTTLAGQPAINYAFDNADRMTSITQAATSVAFAYDDAGRRSTITLPNGIVGSYGYDDASEPTSVSYALGSTTIGDFSYTYDLGGRHSTVGGSLGRTSLPAALAIATYNADNQLTSWAGSTLTYDLNGNLVSDGAVSYAWNARNELSQITTGQTATATFGYDATGKRTARTVGGVSGSFVYDGTNIAQEQVAGSPVANRLSGATDEALTRHDAAADSVYLTDAIGSTVALADGSGSITTNYAYDPFGSTVTTGAPTTNPIQFTGRENDGTGLFYFRARYYNPTYGRFLSEDPAGFAGGTANLYAYANDDPINLRDPSGRNPSPAAGPPPWSKECQDLNLKITNHVDAIIKAFTDVLTDPKNLQEHDWFPDPTRDQPFGTIWGHQARYPGMIEGYDIMAGDFYKKCGGARAPELDPEYRTIPEPMPKLAPGQDLLKFIVPAGVTGVWVIVYVIVSEGSRVVFPVRNLLPAP
jgi:RHS repeat-associated protein